MPDQYRSETVRAFVEGATWPFQCNVHPPRIMPLVHFGKLNVPVRQTAAVYRLPKDRQTARSGGLIGPILGVQVRSETDFENAKGQQLDNKARLDVMREVGGLLHLAQQRHHEGKTVTKPGEGQWWTSKPRWGGGPGGEVEMEARNSDLIEMAEELLDVSKEKNGRALKDPSKGKKRKTPAMLWKELKCGSGYLDPKTEYVAVGKEPGSDHDEVKGCPSKRRDNA